MSDGAAPAAPVAPVAATPAAPVETKAAAPVVKAPEPEPTDDYEIDGKKVTLTRTQARTMLQKAGAVDKRLQSAAEKEKRLNALIAEFEADPEAALTKLGKDPAKAFEALLAKKAKLELMSPEQRERAAIEAERDELKAKQQKDESEKKAAYEKAQDERNRDALQAQLIEAADRHQLDREPETLALMAEVAMEALELGITNITPDQVAQEVIRRQGEHLEARDRKVFAKLEGRKLLDYVGDALRERGLRKLSGAELREYLGPELLKAINEASLALQPVPSVKPRAARSAPLPPRTEAGKFMSESAFDKKFSGR